MAKQKTVFRCQNCASEYLKWQGQCLECESWNTLVEEIREKKKPPLPLQKTQKPLYLNSLEDNLQRHPTGIKELDRVLGGGLMPQSYLLLGGEPGIGKSTLLLQMSCLLKLPTLYISAEESQEQILSRGQRLGLKSPLVEIVSENQMEVICDMARRKKPKVLIIDSIQTLYLSDMVSAPGSVSQVRECSYQLMNLAKQEGITVFVIGHITKEGGLAGPKVLEHMVDTVISFQGDEHYRMLRVLKNRFGPTSEIGVFQMQEDGLKPVENPSELFLEKRRQKSLQVTGSTVFASMEGTRPILSEIQALIANSSCQFPRRTCVGFDLSRVHLIAAILEKYLKLPLSSKEIFINVVGGLKLSEPGADLPVMAALISSYKSLSLSPHCVFLGEVGLTGEIRGTYLLERRIHEALRLGFDQFVLPASNKGAFKIPKTSVKPSFYFLNYVQELPSILQKLSSGPLHTTAEIEV